MKTNKNEVKMLEEELLKYKLLYETEKEKSTNLYNMWVYQVEKNNQ